MLEKKVFLDQIDADDYTQTFFDKIEEKIRQKKDFQNGPYFQRIFQHLTLENETFGKIMNQKEVVIKDDKIYFLFYKEQIIGLAVQKRNDPNKTELFIADYS
ncbi:MAG: hypothetical protein ABIA78_02685 [archaeon]